MNISHRPLVVTVLVLIPMMLLLPVTVSCADQSTHNWFSTATNRRLNTNHIPSRNTYPAAFILPPLPTTLGLALQLPSVSEYLLNDPNAPLALQIVSVAATYTTLVAVLDRPRGTLPPNHRHCLTTAPSQIPNGGLGLYASQSLPSGTILGTYPGVVRRYDDYLSGKYVKAPQSAEYLWRFSDNVFALDPTNSLGNLEDYCYGGSEYPLSNVICRVSSGVLGGGANTMLARINEPVPGLDCNVTPVEDLKSRAITFRLIRDVYEGEELLMDYGTTYDRSRYQSD